jgi:hypothetical protein
VVDYSPAGLETKLFLCEIMYNAAQCYFRLDNAEKAQKLLSLAKKFVVTNFQAKVIQTSTDHFYSVEKGLQFIPELKLSTVGMSRGVPKSYQTGKSLQRTNESKNDNNIAHERRKSFIIDHLYQTCKAILIEL